MLKRTIDHNNEYILVKKIVNIAKLDINLGPTSEVECTLYRDIIDIAILSTILATTKDKEPAIRYIKCLFK